MKTFATTLCIVGTALALSACSGYSDHSGASYAKSRTAGEVNGVVVKQPDQVFHEAQVK